MLPKKHKVLKDIFKNISKKRGNVFHSPFFTLKIFPKEEKSAQNSFFSFVISNKVSKKAVERNLLRRRGYSIIRKINKETEDNFICIFYAKKDALTLSYQELGKEIIQLLKKAKITRSDLNGTKV